VFVSTKRLFAGDSVLFIRYINLNVPMLSFGIFFCQDANSFFLSIKRWKGATSVGDKTCK
jgi:hypothetical protein